MATGSQDGGSPFLCCLAGWEVRVSNMRSNLPRPICFARRQEVKNKYINTRSYVSISSKIEGILYYTGRIYLLGRNVLNRKSDVMFDLSKTTLCVPITDFPTAYSIVNEVHSHHPDAKHSGVETILRYVQLVAYVISGRELVKKYGKNCTRRRILNKNVVKVLMGSSHEGQIKVAPAFFRTQVDLFGPLNSYDPTSKRKPLNYGLYPLLCHHKCHWHYGPQICGHKSQQTPNLIWV